MRELIEYLAKALVDNPDEVSINEIESERTIIFELKVAQEDVGKIIGRGGRIVKAIRILLNAASAKGEKRAVLEVLD
ncbi:KH domain-containing protein [bacterium]|nr:KH domain-containing protein [bacterium]